MLDAVDESPLAQDTAQRQELDRLLNEICQHHAYVLFSVRPQFFQNDDEEATQVAIRQGDTWLNSTLLQLSPFDDTQVNTYLNQSPQLANNPDKLSRALDVISRLPEAKRPMILSHIHEIITSDRPINSTLDLYDTIIAYWIEREVKKEAPLQRNDPRVQQWWEMTSKVASYMYLNKELSVNEAELRNILGLGQSVNAFLNSINIALPQHNETSTHFRQRSMLTREGSIYHFSHKSFFEYFMAYRFLLNPEEIKYVWGMDFSMHIYNELLQALQEGNRTPFADLSLLPDTTLAYSLHDIASALYHINHFNEAEPKYHTALLINRNLVEATPDAYLPDVAMTLFNMAILYLDQDNLGTAEQYAIESLEKFKIMTEKSHAAFDKYVQEGEELLARIQKEKQKNS